MKPARGADKHLHYCVRVPRAKKGWETQKLGQKKYKIFKDTILWILGILIMSQDHSNQLYPMRVQMAKKIPEKSKATLSESNNPTLTESPDQRKQNDSDLKDWHQHRHQAQAQALEEAKRNAYHAELDEDGAIQRKKNEHMGQEWQEKRRIDENGEKPFSDVFKDHKEEEQKKDLERENFNKKYTEMNKSIARELREENMKR